MRYFNVWGFWSVCFGILMSGCLVCFFFGILMFGVFGLFFGVVMSDGESPSPRFCYALLVYLFYNMDVKVLVAQLCLSLCDPSATTCQASFSVARMVSPFSRQEWWSGEPFPSPGESSWSSDQGWVSCAAGRVATV